MSDDASDNAVAAEVAQLTPEEQAAFQRAMDIRRLNALAFEARFRK